MSNSIGLNDQLSRRFRVKDLIVTQTGIPNLPPQNLIPNAKKLANSLDVLWDIIGPFTIHSAYRSSGVQAVVGTTDKKSFHELFLAADITPQNMSIDKAFAKILTHPRLKNLFSEKALKPSQNAIHLAIGGPNRILERLDAGRYVSMSKTKIAGLIDKYGVGATSIGGIFLFLGGLFMFLTRKKSS